MAAFERQFRTNGGRLRNLAWSAPDRMLGPEAAARLRALRAAAAADRRAGLPTTDGGPPTVRFRDLGRGWITAIVLWAAFLAAVVLCTVWFGFVRPRL